MNKLDLIKAVAEKSGVTQKNVRIVLDSLQDVVFESMKTDDVRVMDGVIFCSVYKEERGGRNPQNGDPIVVPAHYSPKCKFGKAIKEAVNA